MSVSSMRTFTALQEHARRPHLNWSCLGSTPRTLSRLYRQSAVTWLGVLIGILVGVIGEFLRERIVQMRVSRQTAALAP